MIKGCKNWDDRSWYNIQNNNAIEKIVRISKEETSSGYEGIGTESCAVESLLNGCRAMGIDVDSRFPGLQAADVGMIWMNNFQNYGKLEKFVYGAAPGDVMVNRYQATGPVLLAELYGVRSSYMADMSFREVALHVSKGNAVQLLQNIGHYVVATAFDDKSEELIYTDSWKRGSDRFNVRINEKNFNEMHPNRHRRNVIVIFGG